MFSLKKMKAVAVASALLAMTACASLPDRAAPAQAITPGSLAAAQSFAAPVGAWPRQDWWTSYKDPQLNQLIGEALANSPSVAQAEARLRAANAALSAAGAARGPNLDFNANAGLTKQSINMGFPPQFAAFLPQNYEDFGRATLNFSYDFDFWGRNRASIAAAASEARASKADAAAARLMLSSAIADAYADLSRLFAERDITEKALSLREQTASLVSRRVTAGLDTRGELRQAEAGVPAARAQLAALDEQLAQTRNRLAALTGAGPDRGLSVTRPSTASLTAFGLPENLTADLLGRRPDIVAARWRAAAANKRTAESQAAFYPNVNLKAFIGAESLGLENLTRSGSDIGEIGPAISLPIFNGGRLRANLSRADAERDAAVASYNGALVEALRQVADVTASARALQTRLTESRAALAANEDAYRIARMRYEGGLSTYQTVLIAEDAVLMQRLIVVDLESRAFTLDVALIRALGGGYIQS